MIGDFIVVVGGGDVVHVLFVQGKPVRITRRRPVQDLRALSVWWSKSFLTGGLSGGRVSLW